MRQNAVESASASVAVDAIVETARYREEV